MGSAAQAGSISSARAWATVAVLSILYFVSFVDRAILALVVGPLKADLGVSDVQLGVLFGPAFAIFYAVLGLPFARVADRGNRRRLVIVGALLWGLCTLASGFAHAYWLLVVLRAGLAIGEATLTPAAYSLIGAMFAPERRMQAASVYSAVGIAGVSGAYMLGALVIGSVESAGGGSGHACGFSVWQVVFFVVGAPAILGALLFAGVAREPTRSDAATRNDLAAVWLHIREHGAMYPLLFAGAGLLQTIGYSYAAWGPEFLHRTFGLRMQGAGIAFGVSGMFGATLGTLIVPAIARAWQARGRHDAIAVAALCAAVVGGVGAVASPLLASVNSFMLCYVVTTFGLFGASTGLVVAMQDIAPLHMRATLVAMLLLCMTLLGGVVGPPSVAALSGHLAASGDRLGEAVSWVSAGAAALAIVSLACARGPLAEYMRGQSSLR